MKGLWIGVGIAFALLIIITSFRHSDGISGALQGVVTPASDGLVITNSEGADWNDCMVGVNGGTGFSFSNPPYKTREHLTFQAGANQTVYYREMSADDGTIFDPATHAVNSIVIVCNQGSTNERYWNAARN